MKACHKFYSKSSSLASTSHSNKSTSDHNKAESSKYYELNIGYSQEKECIQLHFTPQEAYKDDKENSLSAGETFSNNFAINFLSGTNKPQRNTSALLTVISSNDDKLEKKRKEPININLTSTSISASSIKLIKTGENKDLANKRKMTLENDIADSTRDDNVSKHLKGRFKEASTDPKDIVIGVANKKVKSKKIQTSKNIIPIEDVSAASKKKKNKGTYVEQQEIYSASNPNESISTALIPSLRVKSSISTKSSIIRKRKHRRKKHHRHHRHRSGEREGKAVPTGSSATLKSHVLQEILPIQNKPKGLGFFFLKNKLVWPVHSKNYAGEDSHKDETIACITEEINKCKTKIKNKVDNYKDLLEVQKPRRVRRGSTETLKCEAKCNTPDNVDTVVIKKPDELNSSSELNVMVKKKHKRIKECSSNSANDTIKAEVETKLKKKHKLRRDSRNELRKVVSSKIKHKDSKYKKIDSASNVKIRSSDGLTGSQKHKRSKTELESSHHKNETDSKREKKDGAADRHKKRSKSKYNESEILDSKAQYRDNTEENAGLVVEPTEVGNTRRKKHRKEKALNDDLILGRDKPTKKMKNKKVDTHSLVNIKQKHSKHKHRKSSRESKHSFKNDKNNSDTSKRERHKSSSKDTKKSDEKKYTHIYEKYEDIFDENWDDRKSIKISRNQLREFLQEITGNLNINESKTEQTNTSHKDKAKTNSLRKEVSFSHLNLNPVAALYTVPALNIKAIAPKSSALRASPSTKEKKQVKSKKKGKESDEQSVVSEAVTKKEKTLYVSGKRFQSKSSSRSVCLKTIEKVRKEMQQIDSFSVKGMQPHEEPKSTRSSSIHIAKKVAQRGRQKLEKVVLSVVEIKPAKFFAGGLKSDKLNKTVSHNHRGASNVHLSKKRKNKEATVEDNSSEAASKSSASGITTIQAIYLADDNLETKLSDANSRAAIMENLTQPDEETPLIQQVVLSKGKKQRVVQNKSSRSANVDQELLTNSNKMLKRSGRYQKDSSLEQAQMQTKKPTKSDCQKFLQTSPVSSREPSTDEIPRTKSNKNKYSSTRLKSCSISSIKCPKSYKSKTPRHTSPLNNGNRTNSDLKLNRIYYKPLSEVSPSLSSGLSLTSMECYQMRDSKVFKSISNKKASLSRSRQRSGQIVNPRIKEYAKQCERRQRLSRDSSISSKSSVGRNNSREVSQGRTNKMYSHLIDSDGFLQQIHPKNQIKTHRSLYKNPYILSDPHVESDSFQAVQGGKSKIKKQAAISIPSATSKLDRNQQVNKNLKDVAGDSHSSEKQWHNLLADAEGYLNSVQSNLQDILSGDLTALTKITEETSQESMRFSNLSHSSRHTRRESSFNCKKASNIDNASDRQALLIARGNNFDEVNRKYQVECGSNQERKTKKKSAGNLQAEDRFSGQTKHRKRNNSDTNYGKPDKIFSPYCVEKGKILQIFNIDTAKEPATSTETKNLNRKINHKSRENVIQNLQGAKRSSFNDVIVSPCIANNELEVTPVKDIKSSSEERDNGDTEAASSNDSGSRQLAVITISTHLDKATNQEQENTQNAFIKKEKSSNNISNDQDLVDGMDECNGFEDTDNRYSQTNSALLIEEVTVDNVENAEEELKESKIRLANSFKKSIMEELQTANFLQQNDDIVQLIVDNSNEEELVQLNEIISQNVSNLVKQKVRSMLRFEEVPEPADGNVLKRESSPTMCPKLDIQTEANKIKHYDNTTDVKTRENNENTHNFNSGTHKKCHQQSIDTTKRENKNDAFVSVSKSSQESNSAVSKPKANTFLVSPIFDDYSSKKTPTLKVVSKNSTHIQLSQVTHRPLTNTTHVNSAGSRDSSNRSNIYNTQRSSEANLEFNQHSASSDYNEYWEAKDKKPRQTSKIPRSKNTAIHALEETATLQAKPKSAPSSKEQQSKASSELFRNSMQLTKFWAEKQENKTNAGSSCSTMANSFRNKPSTCLFTKNDRKDNRMSTFEKRKQYGELLRRKQTRARNQDCIYCCPQVFHFDETGKIQSEKRVLPSRPTTPNLAGKYSEPSTSKQLAAVKVLSPKDRYGYEPHGTLSHHASRIDYCNLCCSICNKLCCCCKKRHISDEDSSAFATSHPSLPTIIRPVPLDEQNKEKSADVNQTLTATVDQENAIKTKFKSKSDVSLFSKESGFSCGSFPHPNSTVSAFSIGHKSVCNSKSNVLYTTGSDKVFCSVGEPKRSLPYKSMARAHQLRERSASGSAVYNVKESSTSKNLLQTMEQNNSASDCPNNVEKEPSVVLTSTHVKLVKARQSVNTAKFIECQRKKSAESECVSLKSTVGKGYRHKLKETKSLSYQNLRRYSQHISQLSDDLKKLNNLSEMPRVASISRNKFKKLVQYVEEHRKVKNDNAKQSKINDRKTQQKPATYITRNNTAQATCNSKQSKETKNVNSNRSVTKTNLQKKTYNNETINEQNKTVEQSSSSFSNHNKNISYKRNNVQTKFYKNSALENKCNDASFTIFNSNKEIALKRKDTRMLIKSDSEECFKIFAYNSIVKLEDTYSLTVPTYINGLNTNDFFRCKNIKNSKFLCRDEYLYRNQKFLKNPSSTSCPEITKNYEKKELLNTLFNQHDNFMYAFAHGDQEPYNSNKFPRKPFPAIITLPVCVKVMGCAENTESSKLPKKLLPRSPNGAKLNHAVAKDEPVAHTSKRFSFDKSNKSHKVARKNPLDAKREQSKLPHRLDYRSIARKLLRLGHQEFKSTQVNEAVWHSDCKESRFPKKRTHTQLYKPPKDRRSVGSATSSSTMFGLNQSNYGSRSKQNKDESSPSADWSHKERKDQGTQCYNYVEDEAIKSTLLKTGYRATSCSTISLRDLLRKEIPSHKSLSNNQLDGEARLSKTRASLLLIFKQELLQALLSSNSFELAEDDLEELSVKSFGQTNHLPPTTKNSIELSGKDTYTLLPVENPIEISKKSTYTILPGRETIDEATYTPWPAKALREMSEKATYTLSQDSIETFEKATFTKETSEKATYTIPPVKRLGKIYEEATSTLLPEKSTETFENSTYTVPLDIESVDRATYTMVPSAVVSTEIFVRTTCTLSGDTLHSMSDYSESMQFLDNSHKEIVAETAKQLMPGSFGNKSLLHEPKGKMYESATTVEYSSSIRDLVKGLFSKPSDELLDMELPTSYTNVIAKSEDENIETIREESTALSSDSKQSLYDEVPQKIKKNLPIKTLNITSESIIEKLMHTLEAKLSEVIDIKCKKLLDEAKNFNSSVRKQNEKSSESHSKLCCQQAYLFNKLLALDEEPLFVNTRLEELHDIFLNNVDNPLKLPIPDMPNKSFEQLIEFKLKRAWSDKFRKLLNLLQESDLTDSQTQINTPSKKKAFISKSIKSFHNLFKRPGKKPTTESICNQTQCPSTCVLKEVAHVACQKSTESLFEEDEEVLCKTKLYTTESTLKILKKFLSKTFKERSKAELGETSKCADTPLMISGKHSARVMVETPPKHLLNASLKTFLTASLKDLPYLPNKDASVKMFENVPSTLILKQKSAQTLLEELQEKFSNKFFSTVNNPLVLFEQEDLQKDNHHKCNARRNCRNMRLCKAEEVSDDILKKMSQMPLTAIVKLHEQQYNDQNPQMSFKTLVEDLYKDIQEDKLKISESQECIVHVLKKSMKKDGVEDEAVQKSEQSQTVAEKSTDKENAVATDSIRATISEGFIGVPNALKYEETKGREANRAESSSTLTPFWKENQKLSPKGSKNKQETIEKNVALTSDNEVDQNFNKTFMQRKTDSLILISKGNKKGYIKQNLLPTKEEDEDERSKSDENMQLITSSNLDSKKSTEKEFKKSSFDKEKKNSWLCHSELIKKMDENLRPIREYEENETVSTTSSAKGRDDNSDSGGEVNKQQSSPPLRRSTKRESRKSTLDIEKLGWPFNDEAIKKNESRTSAKGKSDSADSMDEVNKTPKSSSHRKSTRKESKESTSGKEKRSSWLSYDEPFKRIDENMKARSDFEKNENVSITSATGRSDRSDSMDEVNKKRISSHRRLNRKESRKSTNKKIDENTKATRDYERNENISITSAKEKNYSSDSMDEVNKRRISSHRRLTRKESRKSTDNWLPYDEPNKKIDENAKATRDYDKNKNVSIKSTKGRSDDSDSMDEVNKKRISSSHRMPIREEPRKSTMVKEKMDSWLSYDEPNKKIDENAKATREYEKNDNVSITSSKRRSYDSDSMDEVNKKPKSSSHRRSTRKESTISTLSKEKTGWPFNDESIKKMDENGGVARDYEKNKNVIITSAKGESDSSYSTVEVNKKPKLSSHRLSTGKESKLTTSEKTDSWPSYDGSKQKVNINVALTPENDIVKPDNSDSNSEGNIKQKSLSSKRAATKEYTKSNSKRSSYDKLNQKVGRSVGSENDLPSVARYADSFVSGGEIDKRGRTKQKSMRKADFEKPISSKTKSVSSPSISSSTSIEQIKEKVYKKKKDLDNKLNKKSSKHASLEEDSGSATLDDEKTVPNAEATSKTQSQKKSPHLKEGARSLEVDENFGTKLKEKQGFSTLVSCACPEKRINALEQLREALTDKELFEKLLNSYEREERIVERLSNDEVFIKSQLELIRKKRAGARDTNAEETLPTTSALAKIQEEDEERQLRTVKKLSEEKVEKKRDAATTVSEGKEASTSTHSVVGKGASQSTVSVTKSPSKTKSGFKSRVTRMFGIGTNDNEQMKEIVAPREEKRDSIDQKVAEAANEDNQKVKFRKGGDPFEEEKKMLNFSNTSLLRPHFAKAERRPSQDSNDSNIIKPSDLGKSFLRGFRTDHVALDGDTCLFITKAERERRLRPNLYKEAMIEFSERDSPLEYLLALGFSIDEASNAIKDEDVKNRLFAAITEARIWVNQISTVQGTLLYLVSYKTKPKTMRYFLQLVEAIINKRINNAVKLNSFLRVLEKVEDGDLTMIHILGSDKFDDEENEEKVIKKQLRQLFIDVYKIAEYEAALKGITVSKEGTVLLRIMAAKYRAGLHPHLELIARYIGQGLIKTEVQLEAAMIYLSRLDTADVNLKEFEQYVAIRCKQDQKPGAKK